MYLLSAMPSSIHCINIHSFNLQNTPIIISILEIGKLRQAAQRGCLRPASRVAVPGVKLRCLGQSLCFSLLTHADFLNERLLFIKQFLCVGTKQRSCHSWSYLILTKRDYYPHFTGVEAEVNRVSMTQPSNHRWLGSEQCLLVRPTFSHHPKKYLITVIKTLWYMFSLRV